VSDELLVAQNDNGDTPLHLTAKEGKLEVAELLCRPCPGLARGHDEPAGADHEQQGGQHCAARGGAEPQASRGGGKLALLDADRISGRTLRLPWVQKIVDIPCVGQQQFLPSISLKGSALHQALLSTHHRKLSYRTLGKEEKKTRSMFSSSSPLQ